MTKLREEKAKGLSSNLAEFAGVMTSFNTVAETMGMQKNTPEGAPPTDTLGKLLHYAPSIGQHVVEPVAKRVDSLAQAIRERNAMDQTAQVQQQQGAVAALPMATNPQGGMLPSHQPMPQMVYPPVAGPTPDMGAPVYTQSPAPQAPPTPQAPPAPPAPPAPEAAPQPTPEEVAAAQGVQTLFDLLHERLEQGADGISTSVEVQRLVPREQVEVLKLMDTTQLLAEVGQLVGPDSPLTTPRGQEWLGEVHAALKGA